VSARPESDTEVQNASREPVLLVLGNCDARVWGLSARERHIRAFARAGVKDLYTDPKELTGDRDTIIVRGNYLLAEDLTLALSRRTSVVLRLTDAKTGVDTAVAAHVAAEQLHGAIALFEQGGTTLDNRVPPGLQVLGPDELGSAYNKVLRKRETPLLLDLNTTPMSEVERLTFGAVYKGATDFVTKWCWPVPARWVTRWAAARGITPNQVTTASLVLVFLAAYLFALGQFLLGIGVAWAMTFLDTVDGKLARVTLTSSRWGNLYDHGIDLIHPPFWWWAWYHGLGAAVPHELPANLYVALWIIILGYVLGRIMEGIFLHTFKIQTHVWRPLDSFFRTITARRNPNLAILTGAVLLGHADVGFLLVAAWTVFSLVFHGVRLGQALDAQRRGIEIRSWLNEAS